MPIKPKQMKNNRWITGLLVLAIGLSSCGKKEDTTQSQAVDVLVDRVATGSIEEAITLTGELQPQAYVQVSPKISGRLQRLALDDGTAVVENTWVQKGQVLAVLEHDEFKAQLERAKAAVLTAEAMVTQAKVDIDDKLRDKGRMENLFKEGSVTEKQKDAAVTAYELARAGVQSAEARLSEARAACKLAQVSLDEAFIKAPMSGVVSKKFVDEGNMVSPAGPVVALLPMDTLKFLMDVPAQYLSTMDPNQTQIHLSIDAYPDRTFSTKVEKIYPAINPQTRTFTMELIVPNEKGPDNTYLLRPGMYATAHVILQRRDNAVIVPADSLIRRTGTYLAFVVENGRAVRKTVEVGIWSGNRMEVKSGLQPGQQLVVSGQHKLTDGTPVEIVGQEGAGQQ